MRQILPLFLVVTLFASFANEVVEDQFTIALVSVDGHPIKDINKISEYLKSYYSCRIAILTPITLPNDCFRNDSDTLNGSAVSYIRELYKDEQYDKYMAITEKPLRIGGSTEFWDKNGLIRGLGTLGGKSSIMSTFKLKKESNGDMRLYHDLLIKVSRHEIGHNFGLEHCENDEECVMVGGAFNANLIYSAQTILCDSCLD